MDYETKLDLKDTVAVRIEIVQVWGYFRPTVEERGFRAAAIRAMRIDKQVVAPGVPGNPWYQHSRMFGATFRRMLAGGWGMNENQDTLP